MKFLLTIVMCSSVAGSCLEPHTFDTIYRDSFDCLRDGYIKSIDKMDECIADRYGLTEEELDFIINYDIKYRMGSELVSGEEN